MLRLRSNSEIEATASDWVIRRDAGLSASEREEFGRWQAADARHAEAVERHSQAWTLLGKPRETGKAHAMLRGVSARAHRRRISRLRAVASVLVLLFATAITYRLQTNAATPPGQTAVVHLPQTRTLTDGTVVELRAGAEIVVNYDSAARRVQLLRGEALFHVKKDPNRAFLVAASGVEIRAVGTAFAVVLSDAAVNVVVTEGRVAVEQRADLPAGTGSTDAERGSAVSTLVGAGERLSLGSSHPDLTAAPVPISPSELSELLAWRAPRIEFSDTPLMEAVAMLNRHAAVQLVVEDQELARLPVNGLFRVDNTETLVRLLEASFDVRATRVGNRITLTKVR